MRPFNHIAPKLIAILLIIQTSVAFSLPSGGHLNFCISSNGQINMGIDGCPTNTAQPPRVLEVPNEGGDHHEDCVDIALGCTPFEREALSARNHYLKKPDKSYRISSAEKLAIDRIDVSYSRFRSNAFNTDDGAFPVKYPSQKMTVVLTI